jgi:hypothetical protein
MGDGVTASQLIYWPDPRYSDQQRRAFASVRAAGDESIKADNTDMACDGADGNAMMAAAYQLWIELRTPAWLSLN